MTTGEKIAELVRRCKCGVHLTFNGHRDNYESVRSYVSFVPADEPDADVLALMVERDTVVDLQCYVETPIGFYRIVHYDLDAALDAMLDTVRV